MKDVIVDTNVLVSFLTDRDESQQEQADHLFEAAAAGGVSLMLHQSVITELVFVLTRLYAMDAAEVAAALGDLLALPGVTTIDDIVWPLVLDVWPERISGFADAVLVAVAQAGRYETVATFDVKLARELKRHRLKSFW